MVSAGVIVEVDLAREAYDDTLIVSERAGSRGGVTAEDGAAGVRDRCQASVVNKRSLSGGGVIEELCRPTRCLTGLAGTKIREGRTAGAGRAAELRQTA